jgi:hypothetical protein
MVARHRQKHLKNKQESYFMENLKLLFTASEEGLLMFFLVLTLLFSSQEFISILTAAVIISVLCQESRMV